MEGVGHQVHEAAFADPKALLGLLLHRGRLEFVGLMHPSEARADWILDNVCAKEGMRM